MNVLIIPEDFRKDQYLLRPILRRLAATLRGPGNVRVEVCMDPLLGGVGEALKTDRLREIVRQYRGMTDIFILCVDRDGIETRRHRLDELEREFAQSRLLAVNAWEEIEIWALAGLIDLPNGWRWRDIRAAVDVKERYFEPLAEQRGLSDTPGGGRKRFGEEASRRVPAIRQKCREDFDDLAERLRESLAHIAPLQPNGA